MTFRELTFPRALFEGSLPPRGFFPSERSFLSGVITARVDLGGASSTSEIPLAFFCYNGDVLMSIFN